jgi:chromate transporter
VLVILATALFSRWQNDPSGQAALRGAIAAAVAITVRSCWTILHPYFKGSARPRVAAIALAVFALYVWLSIPAVEVLLLSAVAGGFLPAARA